MATDGYANSLPTMPQDDFSPKHLMMEENSVRKLENHFFETKIKSILSWSVLNLLIASLLKLATY